jgi:hypothetical protein
MSAHPYLRAYLAGICGPTVFLLVILAVYSVARYGWGLDLAIERAVIFPMAVVPNMWGAWNMLYVAITAGGRRWPLAWHGALLPLLLMPLGAWLTHAVLGVTFLTPQAAAIGAPVAIGVYYLLWKYLVGFLNELLGIGRL